MLSVFEEYWEGIKKKYPGLRANNPSPTAMVIAFAKHLGREITQEKITDIVNKLTREDGVSYPVAMRRVPRGLYSEDIGNFLAGLGAAGYANPDVRFLDNVPLGLTKDGWSVIYRILSDEFQEDPVLFIKLGDAVLQHLKKMEIAPA